MVAVSCFHLSLLLLSDLQPGISVLLWQFAVDFRIAEKIIPAAVCLSVSRVPGSVVRFNYH